MTKISFAKAVASGNDFVVIERIPQLAGYNFADLAKRVCDRKFGIGADGLLLLEKSSVADIKMRIFNSDGSEANMCGNGARCTVLYVARKDSKLETKAGIIESKLNGNNVGIRLTDPSNIKLDIPIKVNNRNLKVNFIDTGVPHAVIFVEDIGKIHVSQIGRAIRNHRKFSPHGTNVDFVEALEKNSIAIRTYERGVEDETLACGTGTAACAIIFAMKSDAANKIDVLTKSGEILKVYFDKINNKFTDVWLEGKARIICKGEYYV